MDNLIKVACITVGAPIGICLIPLALLLIAPDFVYSIRDALGKT